METIFQLYRAYAAYLWQDITQPSWRSFFWWTVGLSVFFFALEILKPWRKQQPVFRKDFWLDLFYIFFNFFLFSLIVWYAGQQILTQGLNAGLEALGYENQIALAIAQLPVWAYFLVLFLVSDLISWNVHRLLHRVSWLWEFHKVHHSVEEMGFAAHVRYHWMENVVYWVVRVVPLTLLGFDLVDLFALHVLNVAWGHFNHTNITVPTWLSGSLLGMLVGLGFATLYAPDYGVGSIYVFAGLTLGALALRPLMHFLFNSPEMHIWHHAYDIPAQRRYGVNFGITLALWDYLFGTAYMPGSGRDIRLGFEGIEHFPKGLLGQLIYGFRKKKP